MRIVNRAALVLALVVASAAASATVPTAHQQAGVQKVVVEPCNPLICSVKAR
ncbi:hypothetical protein KPL74_15285 [Bacillus sp. NP157]|nr:hypothetical protein KPL74_15285 [Bacillus sp. NP157]